MKKDPQVQTAIRLPKSFLKRIDALVGKMSVPPATAGNRADVMRLAIYYGLNELEKEWK